MFQVFPSMKEHSQISLPRIVSILNPPQSHPFAAILQDLLKPILQNTPDYEQAQNHSLEAVRKETISRSQFYGMLSKSLLKFLKRELKKIEELITLSSRNQQQAQLNRIKLDKTLKQCFKSLQQSSNNVFELIENIQGQQLWECHCKTQQCTDKRSSEQFVIDLFGFFVRSSEIFSKQLKEEGERQKYVHEMLAQDFHPEKKKNWNFGVSSGQLILQIEKSCQEPQKNNHQFAEKGFEKQSKSKKKRRNKKARHKQSEDILSEENMEIDQQERNLNNFLVNLKIQENDRMPCIVTQQWVEKIGKIRYFSQQ